MKLRVEKVHKDHWAHLSKYAHMATFKADVNPAFERVDFALLVVGEDNKIYGYVTCRETDAETIYWQYGGSFHDVRASIYNVRAYGLLLEYCSKLYKRMTTLIENTNTAMLKLAARAGLLITGVRVYKGVPLLEHSIDFEGENVWLSR